MKTVVFRQSCIYGLRQFGVEDQGWIAHFCIAARLGRPISIYGNGKQVRDVLWIDDLVAAYQAAAEHIHVAAGNLQYRRRCRHHHVDLGRVRRTVGGVGGAAHSRDIWRLATRRSAGLYQRYPQG